VSGDPRFYGTPLPLALATLTEICDGMIVHGTGSIMATHISSLSDAGDGSLIYIADETLLNQLDKKSGFICFIAPDLKGHLAGVLSAAAGVIVVTNPRLAFAVAARALYAEEPKAVSFYHATAHISSTAIIGDNVSIGAQCYIGENVEIGDNVKLGVGAILDDGVMIGARCVIGAHTTIRFAILEQDVHISDLCSIGTEGFGIEGTGQMAVRIPHFGRVMIEQGCHIGASCTIDRGVMDDTRLGAYVMLDNQVHIAHNVQIGDNTIIAAQVGIAGSTKIGKNCMFGGQVGVADHVAVGDNVIVAAQSGVTKDLNKPQLYIGYPAQPARDFWRGQARLRKQIKNTER
jgi:UDP-3-O-[3-hydroxymyristoyl] glucosamine N-acyltransferase